jgi:hypothetical protein
MVVEAEGAIDAVLKLRSSPRGVVRVSLPRDRFANPALSSGGGLPPALPGSHASRSSHQSRDRSVRR